MKRSFNAAWLSLKRKRTFNLQMFCNSLLIGFFAIKDVLPLQQLIAAY